MKRNFDEIDAVLKKQANSATVVRRSKLAKVNDTDEITFQLLEIDHYDGKMPHLNSRPSESPSSSSSSSYNYNYSSNSNNNEYMPIIRMFGITPTGNTVLCNVTGFLPYFYIETPFKLNVKTNAQDIENLKKDILSTFSYEWDLQNPFRQLSYREVPSIIRNIEIIKRKTIMGFSTGTKKFMKITFGFSKYTYLMRKCLVNGIEIKVSDKEKLKNVTVATPFVDSFDDRKSPVKKTDNSKTEDSMGLVFYNLFKEANKKENASKVKKNNHLNRKLNDLTLDEYDEHEYDEHDDNDDNDDDTMESGFGVNISNDTASIATFSRPETLVVKMNTFESDVLFNIRFMIDHDIQPCNWITVNLKNSSIVDRENKLSRCQLELFCTKSEITSLNISKYTKEECVTISKKVGIKNLSSIAPLRILSFDIECETRGNTFPDAKIDRVIQIATFVKTQNGELISKHVITIGDCDRIDNCDVICTSTETELLERWRKLFLLCDPDIVTGYNINNFDVPYLLDRARVLKLKSFQYLGRIVRSRCTYRKSEFQSKQKGARTVTKLRITGITIMDMYPVIKNDHKLDKYTLSFVSQKFLNDDKESVHYSLITKLFKSGNPAHMKRLAEYCLKDAILPFRLLGKLMKLYNYIEMSRVTRVPLSLLLVSGEQIKTVCQLLSKVKGKFLLPTDKDIVQGEFKGAKVFDPIAGYYKRPICTLDFASLYPSIIISYNLCYTTWIRDAEARLEVLRIAKSLGLTESEAIYKTKTGEEFVTVKIKKGLLSIILTELLAERGIAKRDMRNAKDEYSKAVLNGKQLALKISANSVYGFTGCRYGKLPLIEIGSSVTSIGRDMIETTASTIEEKYNRPEETRCGKVVVIYGDTDSVMIDFGVETVEQSIKLGVEAAALVNKLFQGVIDLKFEKVYKPYLLLGKKRYAGLKWEVSTKHCGLDLKGIETVRRDWCMLVRKTMEKVLYLMLVDGDNTTAVQYVKNVTKEIMADNVDMSQFILTKSISRDLSAYKTQQCHTVLARKLERRNKGSCPKKGSRVPFVIVRGSKWSKVRDKAEDPIYALKHEIPIDKAYYIKQLKNAMTKILIHITKNINSIFSGKHTRSIVNGTPKHNIGLMKFLVKQKTCACCKSIVARKQKKKKKRRKNKEKKLIYKSICSDCQLDEKKITSTLLHVQRATNHYRSKTTEYWSRCNRCKIRIGTVKECSNYDCDIFFTRVQTQKKYEKSQKSLEKFDTSLEW